MSDDLRSLGEMLSQAREGRGYSLDEVEIRTRIRVKYLQALETGDLSVLPSPTHAKGFLRNYAQFLGLDANAVAAQFGVIIGEVPRSVTQSTAEPSAPPDTPAPVVSTGMAADQDPDTTRPFTPAEFPPSVPNPVEPDPPRHAVHVTPDQWRGPSGPAGLAPAARRTQPAPRQQLQRAQPFLGRPIPTPPSQPAPGVPTMAEPTDEAPRRQPVSLRANAITGVILVLGFAAIIWLVSTQLSQVTVGNTVDSTVAAPDLIDLGPTFTPLPTSGVTPTASGSEPQFFDRVVLQIAVEQ
ncbi:MAG: helix-turn-helix domain-containing protein, partial [Anaerolineae bacterium]|nr:helix-turn-helix domain-containing protein [Anaerolineae bacterium]